MGRLPLDRVHYVGRETAEKTQTNPNHSLSIKCTTVSGPGAEREIRKLAWSDRVLLSQSRTLI